MHAKHLFVILLTFVYDFSDAQAAQFDTVRLSPIYVYAWHNQKDIKQFRRTVYNLKKVYPYSQIAKNRLKELDSQYQSFSSNRDRKKFVKTVEKKLFDEFDAPLRKLTFSQGKMLIKLIDRETGHTSYSVLKEFKGGVSAFFWQNIARVFGHNLKSQYDKNEEQMLEKLVLMCENGTFDQLYYSMFLK